LEPLPPPPGRERLGQAILQFYAIYEKLQMKQKVLQMKHMRAYEIRMRAARKCAKLYDAQPKASGAKGTGSNQYQKEVPSGNPTTPKTLSDMGTSKQEMSEWRKLAAVPDEDFEEALATKTLPDVLAKPSPVSSTAVQCCALPPSPP
jgi:hypothetical protein